LPIHNDLNNHTDSFSKSTNGTEESVPVAPRERRRRVVLKISGEALQGKKEFGIAPDVLRSVAEQIATSCKEGHEIAVVVGGGNFFRGDDAFEGIDKVSADYVGMLATTMNAICLQSMLDTLNVETRLQTALEIREVAEPYIRRKAISHLEKGRVVIFGAGTGNPFFTTDTAAVLRAAEIDADEMLKATKVDGVYSCDPYEDNGAKFLEYVTYDHAIKENLNFMDRTSLSFCREKSIPIRVFNLFESGNISKAIRGDSVGSVAYVDKETAVTRKENEPRTSKPDDEQPILSQESETSEQRDLTVAEFV